MLGDVRNCQQTFESKKFVDITQQCFALLAQVNYQPIIWIFTESEIHGHLLNSFLLYQEYQIVCSKFYVTIIHNVELSNHHAVVQQQVWYVCTQSHASIKCVVYLPVSGLLTLLCVQPYFFLSVCSADSWIHPNILCGLSFIWIADFTKFHSPFSYLQYSIEG